MRPAYVTDEALHQFIDSALEEDVRDGDHSTLASVPPDAERRAKLVAKEAGLVAGLEIAKSIFHRVDNSLELDLRKKEGESISIGDVIFNISGNAQSILTAERLALNCMQRMSGIATKTRQVVEMLEGTATKVLDTRKTTPNFRIAEKWAVHIGGGKNHRYGLFDMIILKDNHIEYAGGIKNAMRKTQDYLSEKNLHLKIEIETSTTEQVKEVLAIGGVDIIMLDNMDTETMRDCVEMIDGRFQTEASGGITEVRIKEIAAIGVDFISMGALTHSASNIDMSLKAI